MWKNRRTDMLKLVVTFHNFVKVHKKEKQQGWHTKAEQGKVVSEQRSPT